MMITFGVGGYKKMHSGALSVVVLAMARIPGLPAFVDGINGCIDEEIWMCMRR